MVAFCFLTLLSLNSCAWFSRACLIWPPLAAWIYLPLLFTRIISLWSIRSPYCPLNILLSFLLCHFLHMPFPFLLPTHQDLTQIPPLSFTILLLLILWCLEFVPVLNVKMCFHLSTYYVAGFCVCLPSPTPYLKRKVTGINKRDLFIF